MQVEAYVGIARREQQCPLIVEHGPCDVLSAIIGVAKIIVEVGTDALLQQFLVVLDGLLVVALRIGTVGLFLGDSPGSYRQEQHQQQYSRLRRTLAFLHSALNLFYCSHSLFKYLVHITLRVAGCIALKLALVEGTHKEGDGILWYFANTESLGDIVVRQLLDGHVELVAHIAPKGTQHFVVELRRTVVAHQSRSLLQSLRRHLVGPSGTFACNIGIVDGTLTEHHEERDENECQNSQRQPVARAAEEEVVDGVLAGVARLDEADVLVQLLYVLLGGVVGYRRSFALLDVELEALRADGLVGVALRIEIDELNRGYLELTWMAGHKENIVDDGAFDTVGGEFRFVGNLGVVLVEVLGELHHRLLDELQVANAIDNDTQRDGVVSLNLSLVERG